MADAVHLGSGKVRELYALDDERLLLVASDRISTFDVVLPTDIPDKGRVLTGLSAFWFARTRAICANHLLALRAGRPLDGMPAALDAADRMRRARLPGRLGLEGLPHDRRGVRPPPAGRAAANPTGCPRPSSRRPPRPERARREHHRAPRPRRWSARRDSPRPSGWPSRSTSSPPTTRGRAGIIIADTKFEFGTDRDGRLVLGDEALTPDSSRFWPADQYAPGGPQPSFDKQYVRDFCEKTGWNKAYPGPELPADVVAGTRARYVEAFEQLTGIAFDRYVADPKVVLG